jgi:excisionase family DNA binding protein
MKSKIEIPFGTFSHSPVNEFKRPPQPEAPENLRNVIPMVDKATSEFFENQLLSYKKAARYLGISEPYLRRLKNRGHIAYVPIGRRGVRFKLSSLNSWVEEREVK